MLKKLKFNLEGSFKIVQFTDVHENAKDDFRSVNLMNRILDFEKPDLVILTGDNLDGSCKSVEDIKKTINKLAKPMESRNIPWAVIFGNHDDEHLLMSKREMMELYMNFEHNISEIGYEYGGRVGNYNILVEGSRRTLPALNLYLMDSGKYACPIFLGYSWITCRQISWYKSIALKLKQKYNKIIPALMFFHIPLPEYKEAVKSNLLSEKQLEPISCPRINSGLFRRLVKMGDVKGVFVGHDHLNDFTAELDGIRLCYGGSAGYQTYGREDVPKSARVILINESEPSNFKTWMRTEWDNM